MLSRTKTILKINILVIFPKKWFQWVSLVNLLRKPIENPLKSSFWKKQNFEISKMIFLYDKIIFSTKFFLRSGIFLYFRFVIASVDFTRFWMATDTPGGHTKNVTLLCSNGRILNQFSGCTLK